jgi:hypothetical protein
MLRRKSGGVNGLVCRQILNVCLERIEESIVTPNKGRWAFRTEVLGLWPKKGSISGGVSSHEL